MAESSKRKMPDDRSDLRQRAEEMLKLHGELDKMRPADLKRLVHELQVHQIELEMQNDELRSTQHELQTSREKYYDLYDLAPIGYVTVNENGIILEANLTVAILLGQERISLIRQPLTSFISIEDQDIYYRYRKRLLETCDRLNCEVRMRRKDKTQFWASLESIAVKSDDNKPAYRIAIMEITQRKEAEELRGRLAAIVESAEDAIIGEDLNGVIQTWNVGAENIFGYKAEEIIGNPVAVLVPTGHTDEIQEFLARIKHGEHIENLETVRQRKDGTIIPVSLSLSPVKDTAGRIIGISKISHDISERKEAECLRALSAEILGILNDPPAIDDAINSIVAAIKRDMNFDAVGIRLHRGDDFPYVAQDGFSKEFLIDENALAVRNQNGAVCMDKDGKISLECTCGLVISGQTDPTNPVFTQRGSFWTNESFILLDLPVDQDPRLHPRNRCIHDGFHSVALIPLKAGKQIIGILQLNDRRPNQFRPKLISFFEDLGAIIGIAFFRKQAEDEMKKAKIVSDSLNLELEVANEELEAFSYSISHDLRAPLRHMTGFSKLLLKQIEGQQDEKSIMYALLISDASKKMERLIDDLLSYSRLGREEMPREDTNLSDLLKESMAEISEDTKGRDIVWKIGELPTVHCEPSMLKLVLVNLISNALKFTSNRPKPEITIDCDKGATEVVCFVRDNGAGFDMKQVDRLFGVFQRLHTQNEFEGTGIGLANVRRIITLHGGRTWAEGSVGEGAAFYFTLPLPKQQPNVLSP